MTGDAESAMLDMLRRIRASQERTELDVADVKALLVGCLEMQAAKPEAAERLTEVVLDGLRAG